MVKQSPISKEEQELKDKIAALKKENEGDDATDERAAEIDQLYEDLKKLRVSGRDSRPARKETSQQILVVREQREKATTVVRKETSQRPNADGFISVKEAPTKKNNNERKEQTETTKPAEENGNGTANKKSSVFDLLSERINEKKKRKEKRRTKPAQPKKKKPASFPAQARLITLRILLILILKRCQAASSFSSI